MSVEEPDEDDDVRRMLGADSLRTSARHDEVVLGAARAFANEPGRRARNWLPAWAAAAAGLAVVGVALWLGSQRQEGGQGVSEPALVASTVLSAGTVRGGEAPARIELSATPGRVRLELDLETVVEHPRYRVELHSRSGQKIWSAEDVAPRTTEWGKAVVVDVESSMLKQGEYELLLQSAGQPGRADDPTYYYFEVQRRN
jgi:hypothetical protein